MIRGAFRALAAGPALFFISGCCCFVPVEAETLVVVVPSRHDGHIGAVVVTRGENHELLNTAYASAATTGSSDRIRHAALKPRELEEFRKTFAAASDALPQRVETYKLYFVLSSEALTPESNEILQTVLDEVATRAAAEVIVTGHSDTLGTQEANIALSLRRAERVKELIVARGVDPKLITTLGKGKTDLEVVTGEAVDEVRNRRVEITVR